MGSTHAENAQQTSFLMYLQSFFVNMQVCSWIRFERNVYECFVVPVLIDHVFKKLISWMYHVSLDKYELKSYQIIQIFRCKQQWTQIMYISVCNLK